MEFDHDFHGTSFILKGDVGYCVFTGKQFLFVEVGHLVSLTAVCSTNKPTAQSINFEQTRPAKKSKKNLSSNSTHTVESDPSVGKRDGLHVRDVIVSAIGYTS